jgi:hypothetical protein
MNLKTYMWLLARWMAYAFGMMLLVAFVPTTVMTINRMLDMLNTVPADETAYRLCAKIGGPNVGFYFNDKGKLVCTNKRGNRLKEQP